MWPPAPVLVGVSVRVLIFMPVYRMVMGWVVAACGAKTQGKDGKEL